MKEDNSIDKELTQYFQQQKVRDRSITPDFQPIFAKAQQKQQAKKRRNLLLIAASILILAFTIFSIQEDVLPQDTNKIAIAKSSNRFYELLMTDGKIVTNDIHFEFDIATIKPNSMHLIESLAAMLKKHANIKLSIEGHTDSSGSISYNEQLSYARAYEVRTNLIRLGIAENRLTAKGFGESNPTHSNSTEKGRAMNRRVEFVLIK